MKVSEEVPAVEVEGTFLGGFAEQRVRLAKELMSLGYVTKNQSGTKYNDTVQFRSGSWLNIVFGQLGEVIGWVGAI